MKRKHNFNMPAGNWWACSYCGMGAGGPDSGMECPNGPIKESFTVHLFDDESTREKLNVLTPLEAVFDDSRNDVPDGYYKIVNGLKPGQALCITVEIIEGD